MMENITKIQVLKSARGYYVGDQILYHGKAYFHSRVSDYFKTSEEAEQALIQYQNRPVPSAPQQ